ncbi:MAG: GNAT family N-acetyltransferase [Pseudomonadota bacterium]
MSVNLKPNLQLQPPIPFTLVPALPEDLEALVAIRIAAMRDSLERIGRFDPLRARERLLASFSAAHTRHIMLGAVHVGFITLKPQDGSLLLDHFYLLPASQRRGLGSAVLRQIVAEADALALPLRVTALRDSGANRFYLRHGFQLSSTEEFDNHYLRPVKCLF